MYIYRAINQFDEKIDPMTNGLIAKSIIESSIESYFYNLLAKDLILDTSTLERIYNMTKSKFDISPFIQVFQEIAEKKQNEVQKMILTGNRKGIEGIFSTKNGHILIGSTKNYSWISFTTCLENIKTYYVNQEKNKIVVVDSNIAKFYDECEGMFLLALDLSTKESIINNEFIINKNNRITNTEYRGLKNSRKDKEVIYYNRVPKSKIVTVLNALEYELLLEGLLDESYYKLPESMKSYWRFMIISSIKTLLKDKSEIIKYLIDGYYDKSNSINSLSNNKYNNKQLVEAKNYILSRIRESEDVKKLIRLR